MSTVLTREAIKAADDRRPVPVEVPEWGGSLYVMGLSGKDRDEFELAMIEQRQPLTSDHKAKRQRQTQELNLKNLRAKLIVRTAVDNEDPDKAKPIFTLDDVDWLGNKSGAALERVYRVAMRESGLTAEDVDELTEELGKGQSGNSGSDLPSSSDTPLLEPSNATSVPETSQNGKHSSESMDQSAAPV